MKKYFSFLIGLYFRGQKPRPLGRGWVWPLKYSAKQGTPGFILRGAPFLVMFISLYCLTANAAQEQYAQADRRHKTTREISKHPELSGKLENGIRIIEVKASRYKFEPDPIVARSGEKVRLVVTSTDVAHGLAISELKVNISVPAGETRSVEFIADKQGEFHAHCIVYCGPGHEHMHASFIVK